MSNSNNDKQGTIALLQSMFSPNKDILTESTLDVIVTENNGDINPCVNTILDLLKDPAQEARKLQMEDAQRELERMREEQRRRMLELEAAVNAAESQPPAPAASGSASSKNNDGGGGDAAAFEARMEALAERARQTSSKAAKQRSEQEHKQRASVDAAAARKSRDEAQRREHLAAMKQLTRDVEERAAEESAALAKRMEELETERQEQLEKRLEREIRKLKDEHSAAFQAKVEEEVMRRIKSVEQRVAAARSQVLDDDAGAAGVVAAAAAAAASGSPADAPAHVVELSVSQECAMPGDKVQVTWRYKRGEPHKSDWVGFYKRSRPLDSRSYYTTQYTDGEATGQLTFKLPAKLGVCEFRFFRAGAYELTARSAPLHVGPRAEIAARVEGKTVVVRKKQVSGAPSSYDWVALFDASEKDGRKFIGSYSYVATDNDATTLLKLPQKPGTYVVRFFGGSSGYSPLAESNEVVVENTDRIDVTLRASTAGSKDALSIVPHIDSIAEHSNNWLGIYAENEQDMRSFVRYAYAPAFDAAVLLDAPSNAGRYVVRLFERGSFQPVAKSAPFVIEN